VRSYEGIGVSRSLLVCSQDRGNKSASCGDTPSINFSDPFIGLKSSPPGSLSRPDCVFQKCAPPNRILEALAFLICWSLGTRGRHEVFDARGRVFVWALRYARIFCHIPREFPLSNSSRLRRVTGWSGVLGWFELIHSLLPLSLHLCSILLDCAWFLHEGFDDWLVLATFFLPFFPLGALA